MEIILEREITQKINEWYKNDKNALLIDGARQIGKTTTIRNFLKKTKCDYYEFNLIDNNVMKEAFDTATSSDQLMLRIKAIINNSNLKDDSIIFFDEIQEAKDAITAIKFLVSNNKYRFIFSGSLLEIKMKSVESIPVGYLKILNMYPLNFKEFIHALNVSQEVLDYLRKCYKNKEKIDEVIHKQMLSLFNLYLVVGGMPLAVTTFIKTKDISKVNDILYDIDSTYKKDLVKYESENKKLYILDVYNLIPSELNNINKRFILKNLNEKARFDKYLESFTWLQNSGIGLFVYNTSNPIYPLLLDKQRNLFKLYLCDTGLLTYKLFKGNQAVILNGETNLNFGSIYEQFVAQELSAYNFDLFYYNNKKSGEIDFLIEVRNEVIPLEVKSGKDYKRHNALNNLLSNSSYNIKKSYILSNSNILIDDKKYYLPIYLIMYIYEDTKIDPKLNKVNLDISALVNK